MHSSHTVQNIYTKRIEQWQTILRIYFQFYMWNGLIDSQCCSMEEEKVFRNEIEFTRTARQCTRSVSAVTVQVIDTKKQLWEEKEKKKNRWRKHTEINVNAIGVFFLSNVLFKSLLLFLAFGSTLFCSSQLDMVFKWRKSNSFKWIAIIIRKTAEQKTSHTVSKMHIYDILTHCYFKMKQW